MESKYILAQNNKNHCHFDFEGLRSDEFDQYYLQQPPNSIAVFFKSSAIEPDSSQKTQNECRYVAFRDMLVRANQIAYLS